MQAAQGEAVMCSMPGFARSTVGSAHASFTKWQTTLTIVFWPCNKDMGDRQAPEVEQVTI